MTNTQTVAATGAGKNFDIEVIPADELPANWKFDYNCRAPSRGSRAYKEMTTTLEERPEDFIMYNSGIYLANDKYILDGGHTYLALQDAKKEGFDLSMAQVKVIKFTGLKPSEMRERSKYLNTKVTPPLRGERDLMGDWDGIKQALSPEYKKAFEFRPHTNESAQFHVDFLIALMHAVSHSNAEKAYAGKGYLVRIYREDKYLHVIPRINELIDLYSTIVKDMSKNKGILKLKTAVKETRSTHLPNGERLEVYIPESLVWPVYAAFSALLSDNGEWKLDPLKKWRARKDVMLKKLCTDYKKINNPMLLGKSRDVYREQMIALIAP